jgi:flagellar biosynthetic protein FlhB
MAGESTEDDDRTEEPTQKKLDEAIERGDVAKSIEINTLFILGGFTLGLMILSGPLSRHLAVDLRAFLMNAHQVSPDGAGMLGMARHAMLAMLAALALPLGIALVCGLAGGAIQHRFLWTFEPLTPKLDRLSPLAGLKRIFGKEAVVQFVKGLLKIAIVGTVATLVLFGERDRLDGFARLDPHALLSATLVLCLKMMGGVLAVFALLALGDAVYQRFAWYQRQRMTRREIRDEHKQQEGDPEIKGKRRQIRLARLRKRMIAEVPKASVVITNPTHYAVALRYESGMQAPVCVAKGVDALALRIRAVATDAGVPIVENPPLARALHATVEIEGEIPVEHYKAVAEVIGYVVNLRRRAS